MLIAMPSCVVSINFIFHSQKYQYLLCSSYIEEHIQNPKVNPKQHETSCHEGGMGARVIWITLSKIRLPCPTYTDNLMVFKVSR